ncbi:hypothetical protein TRV_05886 [Trichophyton verrucosum HKI 0517]|uniref:Ubiquitin-like modifier HUB1 n=1 Tax=Trichophyton verrucosum (strain HKI 0517) TaxID=663202 RepID=D4DFD9_TRIVH|nr:uncharacterized protein TRV_05886 [Trichophyton verrucosum HKI 0517]EFE39488.1 hypothetical protein TRV_05886 [Trichophyton verrucosum HKI 0517]
MPRSPSPRRDERRSRSPARRHDEGERHRDTARKKQSSGFRWKEKRRDDDRDRERDSGRSRGLERGYRGSDRRRSPFRDRDRERDRDLDRGRDRERRAARDDPSDQKPVEKEKDKKKKKPSAAPSNEPMIIVNVNDRLGTKAAIPCLASDPIRLFKAQVAARIGREPHEILLKRQGERPFKDQLTLEDYGVSNGVQLDL